MRAYVLSGGLGTRLRARLGDRPKALVPFGGRPFLEAQIEWLESLGVRDVVLCLGVGAEPVREHLERRPASAARVRAVVEPEPLGTGGAIAFAAAPETEPFLVVNGDTLAELELDALWGRHREAAALVTIACYRVADASGSGRVAIGPCGLVEGFREKAGAGEAWVSGGIYACEPRLLALLPRGRPASLEREVLPALLSAGERVAAWPAPGRFYDVGTPGGLDEAIHHLGAKPRGTAG